MRGRGQHVAGDDALTVVRPPTGDAVTGITLTQTQNGPVGVFTPSAKQHGRVPSYHKGNGTSTQTSAGSGVADSFKLTQTSSQDTDTAGSGHHGAPVEHHAGRLHKLW